MTWTSRVVIAAAVSWSAWPAAANTSLWASGSEPSSVRSDTPQPQSWLPAMPDLLSFGGMRGEPFVEAPSLVPMASNITAADADQRMHYWFPAISGLLCVGAAVAQLVVWAALCARRARAGGRWYAVSMVDPGADHPQRTLRAGPTAATEDEEHNKTGEDGTVANWLVGEEWGLISSMNSTLACVVLCGIAQHAGAVSPTSGLDWEFWFAFVAYNVLERWVQAAVLGMIAEVDAPIKQTFIAHHVLTMNVPLLSPRVDVLKDLIFFATCVRQGAARIAIASALVLVVSIERTWALGRLRREVREEALPILKPARRIHGGSEQESTYGSSTAGTLRNVLGGMARKAASKAETQAMDVSIPLKVESAIWEDLPQTLLQIAFILQYEGAAFTQILALIGLMKVIATVLMPPLLLKAGEPDLMYATRHLISSMWEYNRELAARCLGRWFDRVLVASSASRDADVSVAVGVMLDAMRNDPSPEVGIASAVVFFRHSKMICNAGETFDRHMVEAANFVGDSVKLLNDTDTVEALVTGALGVLEDIEMIRKHERVCLGIVTLTGRISPLLDKTLSFRMIHALHKACAQGSTTLRGASVAVLGGLCLAEQVGPYAGKLRKCISGLYSDGSHSDEDLHYNSCLSELTKFNGDEIWLEQRRVLVEAFDADNQHLRMDVASEIVQADLPIDSSELYTKAIRFIAEALIMVDCPLKSRAREAIKKHARTRTQSVVEAINTLTKAVGDDSNAIHPVAAIKALGEFAEEKPLPPEAVDVLTKALSNENVARFAAAQALEAAVKKTIISVEIRKKAIDIFSEALLSHDEGVRQLAAGALARAAETRILSAETVDLLTEVATNDSSDIVRRAAVLALERTDDLEEDTRGPARSSPART